MESNAELDIALKEWDDLSMEYLELEDLHRRYREKLNEMLQLQKKCVGQIKHQRYRMEAIEKKMISGVVGGEKEKHLESTKEELKKNILKRNVQLCQMEDYLPRASGKYLKVILGNVNVSILDKEAKYEYKQQYEHFKLIITSIGSILAVVNLYACYRFLDLLFMFLTVWYYCTLTIRESILRVNGSKIRGWWRAHHFISTVVGGVLLVWPDGECYQLFRSQLMWFNIYLSFLSYLQFNYQRGCLYRLKCLGQRDSDMDITVDGFHSWMWKGLSFMLPFLYIGYLWQLYHAYVLFHLSHMESATWQVAYLSLMFLILGSGNVAMTSFTIWAKVRDTRLGNLKCRFTRLAHISGLTTKQD